MAENQGHRYDRLHPVVSCQLIRVHGQFVHVLVICQKHPFATFLSVAFTELGLKSLEPDESN